MTKKSVNKAEGPDSAANTSKHVPAKAKSVQVTKTSEDQGALNDKEKKHLAECEADIQQNLRGTFVLGLRFEQIRDERLYRESHTTFEAYCRERWGLSKTHANRHIQAHACEQHLKQIQGVEVYVPTKESQVRVIADLKPAQWVEVASRVKESVGEKEASADDFGEAREELFPKAKAIKKTPEATTPPPETTANIVSVKFDTFLVSIAEIHKAAVDAYNIHANSQKRKDLEKLLWKIKEGLKEYVEVQAKQNDHKEAA